METKNYKKNKTQKGKNGSYNIKNLVTIMLFYKHSSNTMTTFKIDNLLDKHVYYLQYLYSALSN